MTASVESGDHSRAVLSSLVTFTPGTGGQGERDRKIGLPWEGSLTELDTLPLLLLTGNLHPGSTFTLTMEAEGAGNVIVVFADHQGAAPIYGNPGPPLGAVPGGR